MERTGKRARTTTSYCLDFHGKPVHTTALFTSIEEILATDMKTTIAVCPASAQGSHSTYANLVIKYKKPIYNTWLDFQDYIVHKTKVGGKFL